MCKNKVRKGEGCAMCTDRWVRISQSPTDIRVYPTLSDFVNFLDNRKSPDTYGIHIFGVSGGIPVHPRISVLSLLLVSGF